MKKITITLVFISLSVFSQYNPALDNKNGFKDFKFGDLKSSYNGKISNTSFRNNDGSISHRYISHDPHSLFEHYWSNLYLGFYGNKLGSIDITWDFANKKMFDDILWKLEKLFGDGYNDIYDDGLFATLGHYDKYKAYTWSGENIYMRLVITHKKIINTTKINIFLNIESKKIEKEYLKSGF